MSSPSSSPSLKHELRTPLNHIIGYCEMLIEEVGDADGDERTELVADLRRIHGAGRRLLGVINDLFDESIPESERLDESHVHHEIRTPLNQIIGYAELLLEDATANGDKAGAADLGKIHFAARSLLDLVMANFDSGRFAVEGGDRPGADQTVTLLQRSGDEPADGGPVDRGSRHQVGAILVADDDASNREMLTRRLRRLGHTVDSAEDGRQTVEKIRSGNHDLLLLDLVMPGMSGYAVLEYLRANPPASCLPVIVLSASDNSAKIARSIELGAEDYLPKPFDPALLQARIDSSLEKKRLRDREAVYLRTIQQEKERSDDLLHVILPADIVAELKTSGEVRPRRVENVAVLFTDVVSFTSYCAIRDPETVHRDLQDLVKEFEILTVAHRMEKIKTIGDAYLSVAGLLRVTENPVLDSLRCGLGMIAATRTLPAGWQIRVGVHCGPVVAGVVGRQKYQYDVWGDTVNAAARMQGEAAPGTLCVSAETWRLVDAHCEGRPLGTREIKGRGPTELFEVTAVRG